MVHLAWLCSLCVLLFIYRLCCKMQACMAMRCVSSAACGAGLALHMGAKPGWMRCALVHVPTLPPRLHCNMCCQSCGVWVCVCVQLRAVMHIFKAVSQLCDLQPGSACAPSYPVRQYILCLCRLATYLLVTANILLQVYFRWGGVTPMLLRGG